MKKRYLFFLCFLSLVSCNYQKKRERSAFVYADSYEYSFGVIPDSIHILRHTFILHNNSTDSLVINNIVTSCGCTKVIKTKDYILPKDTLHLGLEVDIGKTASFFEKDINIYFSEMAAPLTLYVSALREKKEYPVTQFFPCRLSETLRSSSGYVILGYIEHGKIVHSSFNILNTSTKEIELSSVINPEYSFLSISHPKSIKPQQITRVVLTIDASKVSDIWGELELDVKIGEKGRELYSLPISCIMTDNFQEQSSRPRIFMPVTCYQIDDWPANSERITRAFKIRNVGESNLIIRDIKHSIGIKCEIGQTYIPPGDETVLTVISPLKAFSEEPQIMLGISSNDRIEPYKIISLMCPKCRDCKY